MFFVVCDFVELRWYEKFWFLCVSKKDGYLLGIENRDTEQGRFSPWLGFIVGGCKMMMDTGTVFSGEASVFREELSLSCFVAMCNNKSGQKN